MNRLVPAVALAACLALSATGVAADTFVFSHVFEVSSLGASGGGTPRGLAVSGSSLLVQDALDDQIFRLDPADGSPSATYATNPFACPLGSLNCVPTQEWARVARDVASVGTDIWLVDKETVNDSTTWLVQLNGAGEFLARFDADVSGADPAGLTYDPRGAGGLLVTDTGADWVTHFDLAGNALGLSSLAAGTGNPTGIAHFGGDLFLVSDASLDTVHEFLLPQGGGPATLVGQSVFLGLDISTLVDLQSIDYDAASETLYLLDGTTGTNSVYVFTLIPEPGTGALLGLGLAALAARRRRG